MVDADAESNRPRLPSSFAHTIIRVLNRTTEARGDFGQIAATLILR